MNDIAQPQAQGVPPPPRDVVNGPRPSPIIDLISSDEDSDFYEEDELEDEFEDAPEEPVRSQSPVPGQSEQQQAGARPNFVNAQIEPVQFNAFAAPRQPSPPARCNQIWGDYVIDDDFDAEDFARVVDLEQDFPFPAQAAAAPPAAPRPQVAAPVPTPIHRHQHPAAIAENHDDCVQKVVALFPGICFDHVSDLYNKIAKSSERLIAHILDQMDQGILYPKAKDKAKDLKRKRDIDEDEEAARKYGAPDRIISAHVGGIRPYIRNILSHEFPDTPMAFIDATLSQSGHRLFSAHQLLEEANRTYDPSTSGYSKIRNPRKQHTDFGEESIEVILNDPNGDAERAEVLRELRAARRAQAKAEARREGERAAQLEEEENEEKAKAEGTMSECGCCFGDYPLNRMVHCDAEPIHWFCRSCALRNAETEVGQSKYELCCMSMDGCDARFTVSQRAQFLDEKTKIALERNEQEANLRLAGIENLASCPFCPYAAEYPPVEVDREFRCQAPDCEKVSCRLCKLESHIPKSCEENAKETGLSVRRRLEEAMSAALIRKCNKCGTPFIKEEGCNKMRCTLKGCGNVQCYVCSRSCDYDHFNDEGRGGKVGNCPLFESVEARHDQEVSRAEKAALDEIRAEHPEYTEDDLKVKVSEVVKKDDEARKARDPKLNGPFGFRVIPYPAVQGLYDFLPMNRAPIVRPPERRAGAAGQAIPVYPGPVAHHHHYHLPDPQLRRAEIDGDAGLPDAKGNGFDLELFNQLWEDGLPPVNRIIRAPAQPENRRPRLPKPLAMRHPGNQQAPADQATEAPGRDWRNFLDLGDDLVPRPDDPLWPAVFGPQGILAAGAAQPPARNYDWAAGAKEEVDNGVNPGQDNDAERRRRLKDRLGRMAVALEDHGAERRRLLSERINRLRAAAENQKVERRCQAHQQNLDGRENQLQSRFDRRNTRGEAGCSKLKDKFSAVLANALANERAGGMNEEGEARQPRDRKWLPRFGKHQEDPPAAALRQQEILDHQERNIQRLQEVARLRREQENDAAATAKRLEILRRNDPASGADGLNNLHGTVLPRPILLHRNEPAANADGLNNIHGVVLPRPILLRRNEIAAGADGLIHLDEAIPGPEGLRRNSAAAGKQAMIDLSVSPSPSPELEGLFYDDMYDGPRHGHEADDEDEYDANHEFDHEWFLGFRD